MPSIIHLTERDKQFINFVKYARRLVGVGSTLDLNFVFFVFLFRVFRETCRELLHESHEKITKATKCSIWVIPDFDTGTPI